MKTRVMVVKKTNQPFSQTNLAGRRGQRGQSGQIVVEYILLLAVGVIVAILITSTMVSRNPGNPGFLIRKWMELITLIGSDTADDVKQ